MEFISLPFRLEFREFCVGLVLRQIDDIFQMAEIKSGIIPPDRNVSGERRRRVEEYYASIDWTNQRDAEKFLTAIGLVLSQSYIPKESKDFLLDLCQKEGWVINGYQIQFPDKAIHEPDDLFKFQFPAGLPFGIPKPNFAVTSDGGGQSLKFEMKSGIGIIWKDVYPNYDFLTFQAACGISPETNLALKKALLTMNQTESEKAFFQAYAKHFGMAENIVPILIPQAWIRWHSLPKHDLRAKKSHQADEVYRLDFVAFWENQRFAILIDDIGHYAVKRNGLWIADEASYSYRLDEDRKLQLEGWHVYRVSNWELRDPQKVMEIFLNLQKIIGF
jgi:hypothetical protein